MAAPAQPWREPVRGGHPDGRRIGLSGAQQLQEIVDGTTPAPPLARLTGVSLTGFGDGTATFETPLTGWLRAADGRIPLGALALAADGAMACAVISRLPAGTGMTTTELTLRRLRPIPTEGVLRAHGRVVDPGPPLALAEVSLIDEAGVLIAHGNSLCLLMPTPSDRRDAINEASGVPTAPDPWRRDPPAWQPGTAMAPLCLLTGLARVSAADGAATYTLPATRWLCAPPPGQLQGGAVAILAEAAMSGAIQSAAPAGAAFPAVELKLNFLRPLRSDGRVATGHGRVVNAGRRIMVARAEVRDADERLIAVASGSSLAAPAADSLESATD
jgi:uncharacterized protein (TIGR00369 family)